MDKIDFCVDKIDEIERRLSGLKTSVSLPCSEFQASFEGEIFDAERVVVSPFFSVGVKTSLVFQVGVDLTLDVADSIDIVLVFDGFEILRERRLLGAGSHSLFLMKSVQVADSASKNLTIKISPNIQANHSLSKVTYFVWGIGTSAEGEAEMSVDAMEGRLAVAIVVGGQLFVAEYSSIPGEIRPSDFVYKTECLAASICFVMEAGVPLLHLFRVDASKNLNHSRMATFRSEELVDEGVEFVASANIRGGSEALAVYVKEDEVISRTLARDTFSSATLLPKIAKSQPKHISIVKNTSDRVIVIVTTKSGATYMIRTPREKYLPWERIALTLFGSIT